MDIGELLSCINDLGITLEKDGPLQTEFLSILQESGEKIQKLMDTMNGNWENISFSDLERYEMYVASIANQIVEENTSTVLYLLKKIEKRLRSERKDADFFRQQKLLKACRRIRRELTKNKTFLSRCDEFWFLFYKILKHEDQFRVPFQTIIQV
jgi:hypothetical protein